MNINDTHIKQCLEAAVYPVPNTDFTTDLMKKIALSNTKKTAWKQDLITAYLYILVIGSLFYTLPIWWQQLTPTLTKVFFCINTNIWFICAGSVAFITLFFVKREEIEYYIIP